MITIILIEMNNFGTLMFVTYVYKQILIRSQKQYYQKINMLTKGTTLTLKEVSDQKFGQNKSANARKTFRQKHAAQLDKHLTAPLKKMFYTERSQRSGNRTNRSSDARQETTVKILEIRYSNERSQNMKTSF